MIADTVKIDLKVLAAPSAGTAVSRPADGGGLALERAIPVFHRWIQDRALDELMVDVADYTHVPQGPGVVLVCHDAIYSLDSEGGELGLLYRRRRETHPSLGTIASLDDRLASVFRRALAVCQRLEREPELAGLRFPGDRFQLAVNDRRVTGADEAELRSALERLTAWLFPGESAQVEIGGGGAAARLAATVRCERPHGVTALLARLDQEEGRRQAPPLHLTRAGS